MHRRIRRTLPAAALATALLTSACGGSSFSSGAAAEQTSGPADLSVLVTSSGPADLAAYNAAATAWAGASGGSTATVTAAQDMAQQLSQGFASGKAPDVFFVDASQFQTYAKAGNLEPYGDRISDTEDFYPTLRDSFSLDGKLYCAPKDFSTLGLQINNQMWAAAGLTDADVPTTWDELSTVAAKLTRDGHVGLAIGDTRDRIGAFMVQAGGWPISDDGTSATADSPENLEALQYVQGLLASGSAAYPKQLDSGWAGEAFGTGKAAMAMEGNWIAGSMTSDYPTIDYRVAPLPEGPAGAGTLSFTNCWGISATSTHKEQAIAFVEAMTQPDQEVAFAKAFGVMPSRQSVAASYATEFPVLAPFLDQVGDARGPIATVGMDPVLKDFDTQLQALPGADPAQILAQLQTNTTAALAGS